MGMEIWEKYVGRTLAQHTVDGYGTGRHKRPARLDYVDLFKCVCILWIGHLANTVVVDDRTETHWLSDCETVGK